MSIAVRNINKAFGAFNALRGVDLKIDTGELVALLGPSGSGKTTLLRIIAGLENADSGEILFHGEDARQKKVKDRSVGFVFQHYALFRHMTVFDNVAFGLRVKPRPLRPDTGKINNRVHELLKLVQLDWVADRFPAQLSGGQRQRIALARALAIEPRVLLLDEPFGSLDAKVRKELRQWLRRFHDDLHITTLFVTHDQEEALEVADRVVVMNEGKVEQIGTPGDVYHRPASAFVLNFLGNVNLFHQRVEGGRQEKIYVRPHQLLVSRKPRGESSVATVISFINPAGSVVRIEARSVAGQMIQVEISQEEFGLLKPVKGEEVFLTPREVTFSEYEI
ncbi:MAG: sulfate ABC transporter ATP-binding protein [Candidatus Omnitrophica bacterium]|nr:sulfate ABC transporter ATP-binding protein [Candidatus Omnitrophota bacterium]